MSLHTGYDSYGNVRSKKHGGDTLSYSYGDADWLDLLTAVSGKKNGKSFSGSYTYDRAGNPTSYFNPGDLSTWSLSWKNGRELSKASKSGTSLSFDYDVNSLRTGKKVGSVQHSYTYASGLLLRESYTKDGTDYTLDFLYDLNNRPYMLYLTKKTGSTTSSAPYYYILNLQGDVVHLVNTAGKAMASYTYDPYGAILTKSGEFADLNPIRYRGYYYDTETGFYYLQSRYYDPALGRFINADSYTSTGTGYLGYNMFAYCENRPTIASDPKGEFLFTAILIGVGVGVATQAACDVGKSLISGEPLKLSLVDYGAAAISGGLAATGISAVWSVVANAVLGGGAYLANCAIEGKEANLLDFSISTGIGAVSGKIGGSGADAKKLVGITKTSKQVLKTAVSKKKISQYTAKIAEQKCNAIKSTLRTVGAGVFANGSGFAYAKRARIREICEELY